jgi:ribosomal protein S18 acetylase RimI-like enzyme
MGSAAFTVRAATPADVPSLMRLKLMLAEGENAVHAVCASAAEWLRDGFGPNPGFLAFVAEAADAPGPETPAVVGMATCSRRIITGWGGPVIFLQDLYVEQDFRQHGIARALVAKVAALAHEIGSPIVELTVLAENSAAQNFYQRAGFAPLPQCLTYVLAGPALETLAARSKDSETLALAG